MLKEVGKQAGGAFLVGALASSFAVWGTRMVSKKTLFYKTALLASGIGAASGVALDQGIQRAGLKGKEFKGAFVDSLVFMAGITIISGMLTKTVGSKVLKYQVTTPEAMTYSVTNLFGGICGLFVRETSGRYEKGEKV